MICIICKDLSILKIYIDLNNPGNLGSFMQIDKHINMKKKVKI